MKKKAKTLLASSLLLGSIALGATTVNISEARPLLAALNPQSESTQAVNRELGTFARLAQELNPAVVNISVVGKRPSADIPERFRRMIPKEMLPRLRQPEHQVSGQGSGVIIGPDGRVLTNNHVVDGATEIKVSLFDGREFAAEVVGRDSKTDLALLKLKNADSLPVAKLGDSDKLAVGDWVMAIGNPFGLEATVTVGVLSGKGRVIGAGPYDDFLQTDASINPGNSGGPLFNTAGEVVGINTAIVRGGQGIGFSIPINMAREIVDQLAEQGKVERGFLGVGIQDLSPTLKKALDIPQSVNGALVASVVPDGPAEKAGLRVSDVVVSVSGKEVSDQRQLLREVAKLNPGSETRVLVYRDGQEREFQLTVDHRPDEQPQVVEKSAAAAQEQHYRVGVGVTMPRDPSQSGVTVAEVVPGSPASKAGLRPGDLIRKVGKNQVKNPEDFLRLVKEAPVGEIALLVERQGRATFVVVEADS